MKSCSRSWDMKTIILRLQRSPGGFAEHWIFDDTHQSGWWVPAAGIVEPVREERCGGHPVMVRPLGSEDRWVSKPYLCHFLKKKPLPYLNLYRHL